MSQESMNTGFEPGAFSGEPTTPPAVIGSGLGSPRRGRRYRLAAEVASRRAYTPEQRLLLLDTWKRSGLPARDFASLVGVSAHTLYDWNKKFTEQGPAGLLDQPRGGGRGSRLDEATKRAILMMKAAHPDWGVDRISAMLTRGPALPASPGAVGRVLREQGYELEDRPRPAAHPDKVRRFERARPGELWQTDLFSFVLKRQNRRVHLVAFMDDHSRFITCWALHASASTALVVETARSGIASWGPPREILTDNGPQYVTWRGTSRFARFCAQQGIRQIVATPRRPQTLGKVERFWSTLWRECVEQAVFVDLGDAQARIGHFIDYYNFQRTHSGIEQLVPADRFFEAAAAVRSTLQARVAANALHLARHGVPQAPLYLTGNLAGEAISVHGAGGKVVVTRGDGRQEEAGVDGDAAVAAAPVAGGSVPPPVSTAAAIPTEDADALDDGVPAPGASAIDAVADLVAPEAVSSSSAEPAVSTSEAGAAEPPSAPPPWSGPLLPAVIPGDQTPPTHAAPGGEVAS